MSPVISRGERFNFAARAGLRGIPLPGCYRFGAAGVRARVVASGGDPATRVVDLPVPSGASADR